MNFGIFCYYIYEPKTLILLRSKIWQRIQEVASNQPYTKHNHTTNEQTSNQNIFPGKVSQNSIHKQSQSSIAQAPVSTEAQIIPESTEEDDMISIQPSSSSHKSIKRRH